MQDYVVATTVGVDRTLPLLVDLSYSEESSECGVVTIAMAPKSGKITLLNLESRMPLDR